MVESTIVQSVMPSVAYPPAAVLEPAVQPPPGTPPPSIAVPEPLVVSQPQPAEAAAASPPAGPPLEATQRWNPYADEPRPPAQSQPDALSVPDDLYRPAPRISPVYDDIQPRDAGLGIIGDPDSVIDGGATQPLAPIRASRRDRKSMIVFLMIALVLVAAVVVAMLVIFL